MAKSVILGAPKDSGRVQVPSVRALLGFWVYTGEGQFGDFACGPLLEELVQEAGAKFAFCKSGLFGG